ncbi:MAG: hypothetical protein ACKVQK_03795 [Burkholderiales bacterium]
MAENIENNSESTARESFGSELFWRVIAGVILISVLWILWLLWQITPKSAVNPIVFQIQQNRQSAVGTIQGSNSGSSSSGNVQDGQSAPASAPTPILSTGTPLENLKMETELKGSSSSPGSPSK